ncbi:MAG: hypothetical protein MUF06_20665 [Pirellulaceae bacterium]|jgi:hypothetical protein|nr:hypothetical protein [Pirellulaceae bacterium]
MKRFCLLAVLSLVAVAMAAKSASALPPVNVQWHEKYSALKDAVVAKYGDASTGKCNVCHVEGKGKKEKNAYGIAVGKFVTKAEITAIKEKAGDDTDGAAETTKKYILEGLAKVEAEKGANGQTYGEMIKAGKLPE